jgi:GNAT superfamily N-acetyltransferase
VRLADLPVDDPGWQLAFPVLNQLRTHLDRPGFDAVHRAGATQGLRFTAVFSDQQPPACLAVAGWRLVDTASVVRKLYVDDLVVDHDSRSQGIGALLLDHLEQVARDAGARCVELDSGHQRADAHRFYRSRGYHDTGLKFHKDLAAGT